MNMKFVLSITIFVFGSWACAPPEVIDRGEPCPANSAPIDDTTCQCFPGYVTDGVSCILAPADAGPPAADAGPEPDVVVQPDVVVAGDVDPACEPVPYDTAQSQADFEANLLDDTISCSNCHRANQDPRIDEDTAYDVALAGIEDGAESAEATTSGELYRVRGASRAGHGFNFNNPEYAAIWIERHLFGVVPEGCVE